MIHSVCVMRDGAEPLQLDNADVPGEPSRGYQAASSCFNRALLTCSN